MVTRAALLILVMTLLGASSLVAQTDPVPQKRFDRFDRLQTEIRAAAPVTSIGANFATYPPVVTITFDPAATAGQQSAAQAIVAGWDWTPRRKRAIAAVKADLDALNLTAGQHQVLLRWVAAYLEVKDPGLLRKLAAITIDGDEPEP